MHTNRARLRANFSSCLFHSVSTSSSSSSTFHTFTHCLSLPQTNSHSLSHDLRSVATPLSRTIYHYAISYTSTLTRINSLSLSLYLTHTLPCPHVVSVFSIAACCCCCCYRICLCVLLAIQRKEQGKQVNKTGQKKERSTRGVAARSLLFMSDYKISFSSLTLTFFLSLSFFVVI